MQRDDLINGVREALIRSGFTVSKPLNMRSISFDIVARRDKSLLLIKILSNVDAFSKETADELKILSEALAASPLLIGERSGSGEIEEGIVYSRFSVPIISLKTLSDLLCENVPPFIFAAPGGLYVKLDSELLHKIREDKNISLGTLAEVAGVSRRTIQMYEAGMGAMIDAAIRLEEFLDAPILIPVDPLSFRPERTERPKVDIESLDPFTREIFRVLMNMGYSIRPTQRAPFEALTVDDEVLILTGLGKDESKVVEKARVVHDISKVTGKESVIFIERVRSKQSIGGTALIGKDELRKIDEGVKLRRLVIERSETDEKY
ncbi:MAG: transcriptional regulator [Methanomassiliicoccales archaeon]|nr:MAG: transcriptional regulator [Methanomassiliicoccales archaeon]